MPEPSEHTRRRNPIEEFARHIPGFRGYLEKEYRRESDELARQWLAAQLERSKRAVNALSRSLAQAAQIDAIPPLDRLRGRLDLLIARIAGAMQGYSGYFDLVRIDEDILDRVYLFDLDLMEEVEELARAIEQLSGQQQRLPQALDELHGKIDHLQRRWDEREDLLRGLG